MVPFVVPRTNPRGIEDSISHEVMSPPVSVASIAVITVLFSNVKLYDV